MLNIRIVAPSCCAFWLWVILWPVQLMADTFPAGQQTFIHTKNISKEPSSPEDGVGIIEHLLQRPLPDAPSPLSALQPVNIRISYPSLGHKAIDADIRQWATGIADAFERYFDSKLLVFVPDDNTEESPPAVELTASYSISRPSAHAISITFEIWNYTGRGHGNMDIVTLNYSLLTGQRLNLVDIFELPDEAIRLMSDWSRKQFTCRFGERQILMDGTAPLVENFSSLTLTSEGLRIHFQPCQIINCDMGAQKVDIPLDTLSKARPLLCLWQK